MYEAHPSLRRPPACHNNHMTISIKKESLFLFFGDVCALVLSLFFALAVRYGFIPSVSTFVGYLVPFSFLFAVSILIYFVAGLYDKHTLVLSRRIPQTLLRVQAIMAVVAVAFFYFVPFFSISPKTFLFIYLVISLALTTLWRMSYIHFFRSGKKQNAMLVAKGDEAEDLFKEVNGNSRYGTAFVKYQYDAPAFVVQTCKCFRVVLAPRNSICTPCSFVSLTNGVNRSSGWLKPVGINSQAKPFAYFWPCFCT